MTSIPSDVHLEVRTKDCKCGQTGKAGCIKAACGSKMNRLYTSVFLAHAEDQRAVKRNLQTSTFKPLHTYMKSEYVAYQAHRAVLLKQISNGTNSGGAFGKWCGEGSGKDVRSPAPPVGLCTDVSTCCAVPASFASAGVKSPATLTKNKGCTTANPLVNEWLSKVAPPYQNSLLTESDAPIQLHMLPQTATGSSGQAEKKAGPNQGGTQNMRSVLKSVLDQGHDHMNCFTKFDMGFEPSYDTKPSNQIILRLYKGGSMKGGAGAGAAGALSTVSSIPHAMASSPRLGDALGDATPLPPKILDGKMAGVFENLNCDRFTKTAGATHYCCVVLSIRLTHTKRKSQCNAKTDMCEPDFTSSINRGPMSIHGLNATQQAARISKKSGDTDVPYKWQVESAPGACMPQENALREMLGQWRQYLIDHMQHTNSSAPDAATKASMWAETALMMADPNKPSCALLCRDHPDDKSLGCPVATPTAGVRGVAGGAQGMVTRAPEGAGQVANGRL